MRPVCPSCKWNPCECSAKWKEPKPPFRLFKKYSPQKLIAAGAVMIGKRVYVVEKARGPGFVDCVWGFDWLPSGVFSCEEVGRRDCHIYDKRMAEHVPLSLVATVY